MTTNWMVDALRAAGEIDAAVARSREIRLMNGFKLRCEMRELACKSGQHAPWS